MMLLPAEKFIRVWQTCKTIAEFCKKSRYKRASAIGRYRSLTNKGVPLKPLKGIKPETSPGRPGRAPADWPSLAKLAAEASAAPAEAKKVPEADLVDSGPYWKEEPELVDAEPYW
jgi:hypothetical protein